jgi:hypothetical protein
MKGSRFILAGVGVVAAAVLYSVPPGASHLYPRCLFHEATGLLCPGCGATRALAALLHGHLAEAMHWNALIVLLLPVALLYGTSALWRATWPCIPVPVTSALLAVALLCSGYRTLP